jgi:hypothetical protein
MGKTTRRRKADAPAEPLDPRPTREEIAREAYAIYLANGSRDGYAEADWLEAERQLIARYHQLTRQEDATDSQKSGQVGQAPSVSVREAQPTAVASHR